MENPEFSVSANLGITFLKGILVPLGEPKYVAFRTDASYVPSRSVERVRIRDHRACTPKEFPAGDPW